MATAQVNGVRLFYEIQGTHPDAYVEAIIEFMRESRVKRARP